MRYCPFCGAEVDPDSIFCLNCGKKLPETGPSKRIAAREPTLTEPYYRPVPTPTVPYYLRFHPKLYHPGMKAPIGDRCVALLIDGVISNFCCFYEIIKDSIRDGQSIGKGFMNLRVIDFNTGFPATVGQSCIRNCLCGCLDSCCCYLPAFIDEDGRRIGDHLAGTVVIVDQ